MLAMEHALTLPSGVRHNRVPGRKRQGSIGFQTCSKETSRNGANHEALQALLNSSFVLGIIIEEPPD